MRFGIVGSRMFPSLKSVDHFVKKASERWPGCVIVSGGAIGVDSQAIVSAFTYGLKFKVHPARPKPAQSYADACFERHGVIVADSDIVIAFWDGISRGTHDTIRT